MAVVGLAAGERQMADLARAVRDAAEGQRNKLLYWALRRAIECGIPDHVAGSVLSRMAVAAGLSEREVDATIGSARKATLG